MSLIMKNKKSVAALSEESGDKETGSLTIFDTFDDADVDTIEEEIPDNPWTVVRSKRKLRLTAAYSNTRACWKCNEHRAHGHRLPQEQEKCGRAQRR